MFGNAKQSIPERFVEKMAVDKEIEAIRIEIDSVIAGKVVTIDQLREMQQLLTPLREQLKPLLERQEQLRKSCEAFITEKKMRGPLA